MNIISENIEKLLLTNNCVVLESFGAFIKNKKSAIIRDNQITPPLVEVSFNAMLKHDDGLLCALISEEHQISYKAASILLNKNIGEFKENLLQKSTVTLGNIGVFCNNKGVLSFEPFPATYLPENYGLFPIGVENREKRVKIGRNIELSEKKITISVENIRKTVIKYAAIILLTAMVILFVPNTSNKSQYAGFLVNALEMQKQKITDSDNNLYEFDKKINAIILSQNNNEDNSFVVNQKEIALNYHLIVASFNSDEQAENFCNEQKEASYPIKVLKSNNYPIKYRCSLRSFTSQQEALEYQKENIEFKNSWILFQKR